MQAGKIQWEDLPYLPELQVWNTNNLCLGHTLGVCPHGSRCKFAWVEGHKEGSELPDSFMLAMAEKLKTAVDTVLQED